MTDKREPVDDATEIQSKLKRAMGNVLPASGGQDISLISSDPFKYSQLGLWSSNLLNDALSQSRLDFQTVLADSIHRGIEEQQRSLIEHAKISIADQIQKATEKIAEDRTKFQSELEKIASKSSILDQKRIYDQVEEQQRILIEEAREFLNKELQDKIKKNVIFKV